MIIDKLDIAFIIKSISELEKLKLLFFDEDQYYLFEHIPKPYLVDAQRNLRRKRTVGDDKSPKSRPSMLSTPKSRPSRLSTPRHKIRDEESTPRSSSSQNVKWDKLSRDKAVFMSSSMFWKKSEMTFEKKVDKFCRALDNIRRKQKDGTLTPMDRRLLKILKMHEEEEREKLES